MNKKWIYWVSTVLLSAMYIAGGTMYLSNIAGVQQAYVKLGYPVYLVPILGVIKLAGAVTVVWRFSRAMTDLAYAGMFFHLLLAVAAHVGAGDGGQVPAVVGLILLLLSFFTQNAARAVPSPYGSWALVRAA